MSRDADTREFAMPDLGEGLTEATILHWLVDVGDPVAVDQRVAEVETAKAIVDVSSPFDGIVAVRHAGVGEAVAVGDPLLSIATAAGSGSVLVGYGTGAQARSRRRSESAGAPAASVGPVTTSPTTVGISPAAQPAGGRNHAAAHRPLAKPPVRKMAKDMGVDLAQLQPSGAGGVITRDDVRAAADRAHQVEPPSDGPDADRRVPLTGVRKRIAEKMAAARAQIPDATTWVDCDATRLMAVRDELNAVQTEVRVTPLALVLRAVVAGLRTYPQLNASLDTEASQIILHEAIHLGFAAQTERGLLVPVIRHAEKKSTFEIAAELHELADLARTGGLQPAQMTGSTFSVSNYGSFGVDGGAPIINHPEAAILGVGRISQRPWVHEEKLAVRQVVQLALTFDHRICDGQEAAGLLRFVADRVERPSLLLASV